MPNENIKREEANKILAEKLKTVVSIVDECKKLADEHKLSFNLGSLVGGHGKYWGGDNNSYEDEEGYYDFHEYHGWQTSNVCY